MQNKSSKLVTIKTMTSEEYKSFGVSLNIEYEIYHTFLGKIMIASTTKGVCYIAFITIENVKESKIKNTKENKKENKAAVTELKIRYKNASIKKVSTDLHKQVLNLLENINTKENNKRDNKRDSKRDNKKSDEKIILHITGTPFQIKIWKTLLKIPSGKTSTYKKIAEQIKNPKASRAVGTAIAANPIAILIPCHRVIQSNGNFGEYHWGKDIKTLLINYEFAKNKKVLL